MMSMQAMGLPGQGGVRLEPKRPLNQRRRLQVRPEYDARCRQRVERRFQKRGYGKPRKMGTINARGGNELTL